MKRLLDERPVPIGFKRPDGQKGLFVGIAGGEYLPILCEWEVDDGTVQPYQLILDVDVWPAYRVTISLERLKDLFVLSGGTEEVRERLLYERLVMFLRSFGEPLTRWINSESIVSIALSLDRAEDLGIRFRSPKAVNQSVRETLAIAESLRPSRRSRRRAGERLRTTISSELAEAWRDHVVKLQCAFERPSDARATASLSPAERAAFDAVMNAIPEHKNRPAKLLAIVAGAGVAGFKTCPLDRLLRDDGLKCSHGKGSKRDHYSPETFEKKYNELFSERMN